MKVRKTSASQSQHCQFESMTAFGTSLAPLRVVVVAWLKDCLTIAVFDEALIDWAFQFCRDYVSLAAVSTTLAVWQERKAV